jgi:DNA-binding response OmpR family regulator
MRLHPARSLPSAPGQARANGNGNDHAQLDRDGAAAEPPMQDDVLDMDPELVRDALARAHQLLSQTARRGPEAEELRGGRVDGPGIAIDFAMQTVYRSGRPVRITPTEFRLLLALVRRRGAVVAREDLRRDVWPGRDVQSRVIDTHIARLRRKLEDHRRQPRHILTALAAGYRFRA